MTDDPRLTPADGDRAYPCDGSDDPAQRCGRHHATGLASLYGGYQCCCGQPWRGAAKVCFTGAKAGDPVTADDRPADGDLRDRYAEALYQWTLKAAGGRRLIPPAEEGLRANSRARADAVLAVRDTELERLRAEIDRLTDFGLDSRDRHQAELERLRAELAEAKADSQNLRSRLHHANTAAVEAEAERDAAHAKMTRLQKELDDQRAATRIAGDCADRFRDVLSEALGHPDENPGDDALIAELRQHFGKTGPEPTRWRDFLTGARAVVDQINAAALDASSAPESHQEDA